MSGFCTSCGAPLTDGAKFCTNCGAVVEAVAPVQEVVNAAPETAVPETAVPETAVPETAAPEIVVPEAVTAPVQPAQPYSQPVQPYSQPAQPYVQPAQSYSQPNQPVYAQPVATEADIAAANSHGTKALVFGILSFVLCGTGILSLVFGIIAIVQAAKFLKNNAGLGKGKAIAGLVLGILGVLASVYFIILWTVIIVTVVASIALVGTTYGSLFGGDLMEEIMESITY